MLTPAEQLERWKADLWALEADAYAINKLTGPCQDADRIAAEIKQLRAVIRDAEDQATLFTGC